MVIKILLLMDLSEEYTKKLLSGIKAYSKDSGYEWLFCLMPPYHRETMGMKGILNLAKKWGADGIIGQFYNNSDDIALLMQANIPFIAEDFLERFENIPNITGGYKQTGEMAADYFIRKGFTNFAFYGHANIVWSRERLVGFRDRLTCFGYDVHYFDGMENDAERRWYYKPSSLSKWLDDLPKPVALFACDDNLGQHITAVSKLCKVRIPEDIAVLGVDNDELICSLSDPPLSSIALNVEKGGYEAAQAMERMILNNVTRAENIYVEPLHIITRLSTDIYATEDERIAICLRFIHNNIDNKLQVPDILSQVPMSRRVFEKRFQEITGQSIYKYISALRMEKFAENIINTKQSINEIAHRMGFDDGKNISRRFKDFYSCSPNEYRKKTGIFNL